MRKIPSEAERVQYGRVNGQRDDIVFHTRSNYTKIAKEREQWYDHAVKWLGCFAVIQTSNELPGSV